MRQKIAVIGSGISGMAAAWLLHAHHDLTLFEQAARIGGHSNTVTVRRGNETETVDMGFIVFNETAYPNLTALFGALGVPTTPSDMSLSISLDAGALEYSSDAVGLFAQQQNLFRARFWSMLRDLVRFYRDAPREAPTLADDESLGAYLARRGYGAAFRDDHLLPMAAAIWSAPAEVMLAYPAAAFIRFYENHGLLNLVKRPTWRTVTGGCRTYVERLTAPFAHAIRRNARVVRVRRDGGGVGVTTVDGSQERYDHVVIATHADQALALLDDPRADERALLGAFRYSRNLAVLHTDPALMPARRAVWASWNYVGRRQDEARPGSVTYWMNRLQSIDSDAPYFVTLNPRRAPAAGTILRSEMYEHPQFDAAALRAQRQLWQVQGCQRTWYCGAYFGAGFHEDGLQAGLAVAEALGGVARPWRVANESGRIAAGPHRRWATVAGRWAS